MIRFKARVFIYFYSLVRISRCDIYKYFKILTRNVEGIELTRQAASNECIS